MSAAVKCAACNDTGCIGDYIDCISCGAAVERVELLDWCSRTQQRGPAYDDLWAIYCRGKAAGAAQAVPEGWKPMPVEATKEMLSCIVHGEYPDDVNAGMIAQRTRGFDQIPPVHEYETAWGQYQRLLAAAPKAP